MKDETLESNEELFIVLMLSLPNNGIHSNMLLLRKAIIEVAIKQWLLSVKSFILNGSMDFSNFWLNISTRKRWVLLNCYVIFWSCFIKVLRYVPSLCFTRLAPSTSTMTHGEHLCTNFFLALFYLRQLPKQTIPPKTCFFVLMTNADINYCSRGILGSTRLSWNCNQIIAHYNSFPYNLAYRQKFIEEVLCLWKYFQSSSETFVKKTCVKKFSAY